MVGHVAFLLCDSRLACPWHDSPIARFRTMQSPIIADRTNCSEERGRCVGCFRPHGDCHCAAIPAIDNRTEVLILQHRRERFHPFNTARMVHRALRNSSLLVDHISGLAARLALKPHAGLLYPGPGATLLTDLRPHERPQQLVVIDGTWHHAKTLVRDLAALRDVPRYRLAPVEPSRYRIRREPSALLLSTVEATVAALRALEPETSGFDQLLAAFDGMIDRQLAHPKAANGWRRHAMRRRCVRNIPAALLGGLAHVVVVYGESAAAQRDCIRGSRLPAGRLSDSERASDSPAQFGPRSPWTPPRSALGPCSGRFCTGVVARSGSRGVDRVPQAQRRSGGLRYGHGSAAQADDEAIHSLPGAQGG